MHVGAVDNLDAMFPCSEVLHGKNFVGGKRAQDVCKPQGFGVALLENVVADQFFHGFHPFLHWNLVVDVQAESHVCLVQARYVNVAKKDSWRLKPYACSFKQVRRFTFRQQIRYQITIGAEAGGFAEGENSVMVFSCGGEDFTHALNRRVDRAAG